VEVTVEHRKRGGGERWLKRKTARPIENRSILEVEAMGDGRDTMARCSAPKKKGMEGDTTEVMRIGPALRSEGAGKRRALELEINEARL
jgi:hypothetical protein